MNKDIFEVKWKEMRGQLKRGWGKLTNDELNKLAAVPTKSSACCSKIWLHR